MNDDKAKETQDEIFSQTIYDSAKAFVESGQAVSPGVKNEALNIIDTYEELHPEKKEKY